MQFRSVLPLLSLAASASAALSASQVTANIDAVTDLSADNNEIAKSISLVNVFSTAPQLIQNFRSIVTAVSDDVTAMRSKRSLKTRQDCLDVTDIEKCLKDIGEIVEDPSEILGSKRSVEASKKMRRQSASYSDVEQEAICTSFRDFVMVHQQLLATVIGKHGLLSQTPYTSPIAAVLRTLEGVVDEFAFDLIDSVPTCAQGATQNKNSLDDTLADTITEYE